MPHAIYFNDHRVLLPPDFLEASRQMIFDGRNGGTVELLDNGLVIRRKGAASFLTQGLKGEKRIPYSSITSVQFKEAGFTTGYIQFGIAGAIESRGGVWDATTDENTVLFTKEGSSEFHQLRDIVEERAAASRMGSPSAPTVQNWSMAEELTRLADLKDRGVLTVDEFDEQKRALLARTAPLTRVSKSAPVSQSGSALRTTANRDALAQSVKATRKSGIGRFFAIGCLGLGVAFVVFLIAIGSQIDAAANRAMNNQGAVQAADS